jgi:hypothetical protein
VFLTYQYGLRPKRHQYPRLEAILEGQRLLYNAALEERSQARASREGIAPSAESRGASGAAASQARQPSPAKGTVEHPGKNVRQKAGLNRKILEVSPGMMISMLRDKAERAGGWFAVIDARNTSQECSQWPHGPEGPVGPYPKDARIARWRSTATSTRSGTS